jgi:hypothetical protein
MADEWLRQMGAVIHGSAHFLEYSLAAPDGSPLLME